MKTGIVKDRRYLDHDMGPYHVETPRRLEAIYRMLEEEPLFPAREIAPRPAREDEIGMIHTTRYIRSVRETAGRPSVVLDPDTSTSPLSYETALLAAGGVIEALDAIMEGRVDNGFALIRPPGHHAEADRAMGFCLFNNIAVGAEHLVRKHGLKRIFIYDWDLHHGNGTQHAFDGRRDVLYASTHQYPHYPGTGHWREAGSGVGEGFTVNVPLSAGKTEADYMAVMDRVLAPIAASYEPEFMLVSAGFDIYAGDPLGQMEVSENGFAVLARGLMDMAGRHSRGRLLVVLEGGYDIEGQSRAVRRVLGQLGGTDALPRAEAGVSSRLEEELERVIETQRKFWPL